MRAVWEGSAFGTTAKNPQKCGVPAVLSGRKFGAVALLSCCGSPVAWHFKQGAAVEENKLRAISVSFAVSVGTCSGM